MLGRCVVPAGRAAEGELREYRRGRRPASARARAYLPDLRVPDDAPLYTLPDR
jgi:hypothetical protein